LLLLVISLLHQRSGSSKMKKFKNENFLSCSDIETGKLDMIQNVESNIVTNRFNDGKVDPCGRYFIYLLK
jgi:sugar lactone lactonase YvrE